MDRINQSVKTMPRVAAMAALLIASVLWLGVSDLKAGVGELKGEMRGMNQRMDRIEASLDILIARAVANAGKEAPAK